jgi:hypothetical protein
MDDVIFIDQISTAIAVPKQIPAAIIITMLFISIFYSIYREKSEENNNYTYVFIIQIIFIYVIIETSRTGTVVRSGLFSPPWNEIRQSCLAPFHMQEYHPMNHLKTGMYSPFSFISWPASIFSSSNTIITLLYFIEIILHYCIL